MTGTTPGQPPQYGELRGPHYGQDISQPLASAANVSAEKSGISLLQQQTSSSAVQVGAPQLPLPTSSAPTYSQSTTPSSTSQNLASHDELPSLRPVFGVSLGDLLARDGSAIPLIVYQCLQAVELFGLDVEGIYRLSGSTVHVSRLRALFDNGTYCPTFPSQTKIYFFNTDATQVDFRDPANFFHDVNSVAGLLKQFFRDLPDPLLTRENYQGFIEAASKSYPPSSEPRLSIRYLIILIEIDDDITRRDSLHATINSLPDPNYATLRALTLVSSRCVNVSP